MCSISDACLLVIAQRPTRSLGLLKTNNLFLLKLPDKVDGHVDFIQPWTLFKCISNAAEVLLFVQIKAGKLSWTAKHLRAWSYALMYSCSWCECRYLQSKYWECARHPVSGKRQVQSPKACDVIGMPQDANYWTARWIWFLVYRIQSRCAAEVYCTCEIHVDYIWFYVDYMHTIPNLCIMHWITWH